MVFVPSKEALLIPVYPFAAREWRVWIHLLACHLKMEPLVLQEGLRDRGGQPKAWWIRCWCDWHCLGRISFDGNYGENFPYCHLTPCIGCTYSLDVLDLDIVGR